MKKLYVSILGIIFAASSINAAGDVRNWKALKQHAFDVAVKASATGLFASLTATCLGSAAFVMQYPARDIYEFYKNPSRQEKQFVTLLKFGRSALCLPLGVKLAAVGILAGKAPIFSATFKFDDADDKDSIEKQKKRN